MHTLKLVASIRTENAMDLALVEQPNVVRRRTLKDLVAFDATDIHFAQIKHFLANLQDLIPILAGLCCL